MDRFTHGHKGRNNPCERAQRLSASWIVSRSRCTPPRSGRACAQRLSASWIVSLSSTGVPTLSLSCSTPVGVMDRFTALPPTPGESGLRAQRLSASWIVSLPCGRRVLPLRFVLNACRRHGSFHGAVQGDVHRRTLCAQRLSASWIVSLIGPRSISCPPRVLNACRRHGSFHAQAGAHG